MHHAAVAIPVNVMRTLAHELRQPLSTIESIAYYLTLILPEDQKVREQLDRIQHLVEQSNWMITSGQFLSEGLTVAREEFGLGGWLAQINLLDFNLDLTAAPDIISADPALLRGVVENLMILFRQFPERPILRISECVVFEFFSPAPGYRSESSLGPGASLSIQGARRVAEAHGGSLVVSIDPSNGVTLRLTLPEHQA